MDVRSRGQKRSVYASQDRLQLARPFQCTDLRAFGALWSNNLLLVACRARIRGRRVTWFQRFAKLRRVFTDHDVGW